MSQPASASEQLQRLEQLVPLCESIRKGTEYAIALAHARGKVLNAAALPVRLENLEPALRLLKGAPQLSTRSLSEKDFRSLRSGQSHWDKRSFSGCEGAANSVQSAARLQKGVDEGGEPSVWPTGRIYSLQSR